MMFLYGILFAMYIFGAALFLLVVGLMPGKFDWVANLFLSSLWPIIVPICLLVCLYRAAIEPY